MIRVLLLIFLLSSHLEVFSFDKEAYKWKIPIMMNYQSFVISDDGTKVVACHRQGFDIYNCSNNKIIARVLYKGYSFWVTDALFMSDNEIIFIADDQFRYYNISEDREELFIEEKIAFELIFSVIFSEDKKYFAFKSFKSFDSPRFNIKIVDVEAREVIHTLEIDLKSLTLANDNIGDIAFTKDNKLLVLTSAGYMLRYEFGEWNNPAFIKDIAVQLDFPQFERGTAIGNIIEVITDSTVYCEMLAECGLFDINTGLIERRIPIYELGGSINISNKKRYIFFSDPWTNNYNIYDIHEDRIVHSGEDFMANSFNNGVGILDDTHELIGSFTVALERFDFINNQHTGYFGIDEGLLAFSPDNKYLYSYYWGDFKIDIQTGEIVKHQNSSILEYNNSMTQYVYYDFNQQVEKPFINVYDIAKDKHISLEKFSSGIGSVIPRFSDDDKLLAFTNSSTGMVYVFETESYSVVDSFYYFNFSSELNLSFSPNNQYLSFVESHYNELNENEFLNFRDITNKTFLCENLTTGSIGFKYEFLSNDLIIGLQRNKESCMAISEICSVSQPQVTFCPIHKSDFITNFSITKDKRYCIAGVQGKGAVQYHHLFIYDIVNRQHIDSIAGNFWTFTISNDQKYLAAIDIDNWFLYLYELDKVISSVGDEIVEDVSFTVHPNPASEYIEISSHTINPTVNRRVDEGSEIKIFNTLGIEMLSTPSLLRNATPQEGNLRIDVSHLPRGVYYVRIGSRTQMFVKM